MATSLTRRGDLSLVRNAVARDWRQEPTWSASASTWRVVLENAAPYRSGLTPDSIRQDMLNAVLPDDESREAHPWSWLAERARVQGIEVTADELKALEYEVILTKRLFEWLTMS